MEVKIEIDSWTVEKSALLSVSHNGLSWSTIRLGSEAEVKQVLDALQKFSGLTPFAPDKSGLVPAQADTAKFVFIHDESDPS
jgi:hypothetical protein